MQDDVPFECMHDESYHASLRVDESTWIRKDTHNLLHSLRAFGRHPEATNRVREVLEKENGAYTLIRADRCLVLISVDNKTFIGWVPVASRPGDSLCIVYGCPFPLVIRAKGMNGVFEMLGDAYLDGLATADVVPQESAVKIWYPDDTFRPSPRGKRFTGLEECPEDGHEWFTFE
ncbi:hypothetical protein LTR95_002756 [Oleoguttula sp. CCFEE 5521]